MTGKEMQHADRVTVFDEKDYEYVVLRDESQKKEQFRVFKSPKPIPA